MMMLMLFLSGAMLFVMANSISSRGLISANQVLLLMILYPSANSLSSHTSHFLIIDNFAWLMISLTLFSFWFMIISSNLNNLYDYKYMFLKLMLTEILIFSFSVKSFFWFYFSFELSLLPIFFMIMGWGYQPERLSAGANLMIYTILGSLPLLFLWVQTSLCDTTKFFYQWKLLSSENLITHFSSLLHLMATLAFLIKFPMYGTHLWLPKAHVEAPVAGSMVLAAVLLKLGGYGITRSMPLIIFSNWLCFIKHFSLIGGALVAFLCLRQTDMKVLIAYSSVSHMSLAISALFMGSSLSLSAGIMMLVAHGLSSAGMFAAVNLIYTNTHSRNLLISKSMMTWTPVFTLFWFILCLSNMGGPPTINLISEIYLVMALMSNSLLMSAPLSIMIFLAVGYTLILYASSMQGQMSKPGSLMTGVSPREILIISIISFSTLASPFMLFLF